MRRSVAFLFALGATAAVVTGSHTAGGADDQVPTGTFLTKITRQDLVRAGLDPFDAHWETVTFTKDGRWRSVWFHPTVRDQPPEHGRYRVTGGVLRVLGTPDSVRWRFGQDRLTFEIVHVPDALARLIYTAHPWQRVR